MASYLDKFKVKVGIEKNTKLDMSCQHITTADFMQLAPVYIKEMVPGERISVHQETFTRLAPMPVPTFGRGNVHNRAFFVPYRTIYKGWNDFITDATHICSDGSSDGRIGTTVPYFTMKNLLAALFMVSNASRRSNEFADFVAVDAGSTQDADVIYSDEANPRVVDFYMYDPNLGVTISDVGTSGGHTSIGAIWKPKGRQVVKILESIGYKLVGNSEWYTFQMSALPLMAFFKVYIDWYFPSQYYGDTSRAVIEAILNDDRSANGVQIGVQELSTILSLVTYVNYDSDYFVSAFDNPQGPTTDAYSNMSITDITLGNKADSITTTTVSNSVYGSVNANKVGGNGTPLLGTNYNATNGVNLTGAISQYALTALKSLTDYMKRHQLVGARAMDRYLARFGKNLAAEKLNRSNYIGHTSFGLQFGDIMSQSDTDGAQLGAYAGKGLGYGTSGFDYDTDEYGLFIICNSIVPTVGYCQGIDRTVMHLAKLDFWTPEFDQLGNQAIGSGELYVNSYNGSSAINDSGFNTIFGYTPRYAEYKIARDRLSGDFRIPHNSQSGDTSNAWHMMRLFNDASWSDNGNNVKHSKNFVLGTDGSQYNRIFYNTESTADHFYVIHNFNIVSWSPMHALYDTYEFDSKGDTVVADVNGVKVN